MAYSFMCDMTFLYTHHPFSIRNVKRPRLVLTITGGAKDFQLSVVIILYACMYICTCMVICVYIYIYIYMYIYMYIYVYTYARLGITGGTKDIQPSEVHDFVCMYVHIYMYVYVWMYTYTYRCTYIYAFLEVSPSVSAPRMSRLL